MVSDLRYAIRSLAKSPGFTAVTLFTLALGIGANTAMFSLLDRVVLRLLPVKEPERLVMVTERGNLYGTTYGANNISWPLFEDLRDGNHVFSDMFCRFPTSVTLGDGDRAAQVTAELVSAKYFSTLGVNAALGRIIVPSDDLVPDNQPVVVLSYNFWESYFNADRSIVGHSLLLNDCKMTVIGVAQPGFDGVEIGNPAKLFVPIMMKTEMTPHSDNLKDHRRRVAWVTAYGRLKPGISDSQAQASLQPLLHGILEMEVQMPQFRQYSAEDRQQFLRNRIELVSGSDSGLRDQMRKPLWILVGLTGAVLLLACANLANLTLARATAREQEISLRLALGASRGRIVRQLMAETLLLSGVGAVLALGLATLADLFLFRIYLSSDTGTQFAISAAPGWRVLVFALGLLLVTALAFGLLPAIRGSRADLISSLKEKSGTGATGSVSLRRAFAITQVSISLPLLVGAALFVRTLRNLEKQDPGFSTSRLLTFKVDPSLAGYTDDETESYYDRLAVNLQSVPGVLSVGFSAGPLLRGWAWHGAVLGRDFAGAPSQEQPVLAMVGPDYFSTLGIPILAGRPFTEQDRGRGSIRYAIVNQSFVKRFLPAGDPLGRRFGLVDDRDAANTQANIQVIGVIPDSQYRDLRETPPPQAYFPYFEDAHVRDMNIYLRTRGAPRLLEGELQERMRQFDPRVPVVGLETMDEQIDRSLKTERLVASLSAVFGGLALLLAVTGLYGVMAYSVTRRTREMGIRLALGATPQKIVGMVMRETSLMVWTGLAVGAGLVPALASLVQHQLFGLNPYDPWTVLGGALCLAVTAGLAGLVPALRASSVNPINALRHD